MTYFGFLLRFVVSPIIIFLASALWDNRHGRVITGFRNGNRVWAAILIHIALALFYTTPWDNYLVSTGVWTYNPKLVTGVVFGYVPLEEYTFFLLETILCCLWWWFLARRIKPPSPDRFQPDRRSGRLLTLILSIAWIFFTYQFFFGTDSWNYLGIIFFWALPPIILQILFGADILWHYRRLVVLCILPMAFYLSATDSLAIASGTWTISPTQTTGILIGVLPIEEAVFFLVTNVLITFGLTLLLSELSQQRLVEWRASGFKGLP